ncbi:MAG: peptide chain release factor N(5)-glutamine methyltransferase [Sulfuricaulis sp.]
MKHAVRHDEAADIRSLLRKISSELQAASSTARLDAEVLVMLACGLDRSGLIKQDHLVPTGDQRRRLDELLARRKQGEPIAYITGVREFWSMELMVSPAVLIPRPETELLVEKALACIPPGAPWTIADLGTGSGAIALAIAAERPHCRVLATDRSPAALDVARANAAKFGLSNIEFRAGDWNAPLAGEALDMVLSNPPYIRSDDPHLQEGDVRFEPQAALDAGADGLEAMRHIARHARQHLKPGGGLWLEHGGDQAGAVRDLLNAHGYRAIVCHRDPAGHERVTGCRA